MKKLLVFTLLLGSFGASAHNHIDDKMTFEEAKSKMTSHIDEKISKLQGSKACVSQAKDKAALKECKKKMWEEKKQMKEKKKKWKESNKKK
jgi:hypothetical protein